MKGVTLIHFVRKVALYVSTSAVNRNKRKVLSAEEKVKLIQQTEDVKKKAALSGVWSY
jgi:uroporphyrinogen-III decarboxylase